MRKATVAAAVAALVVLALAMAPTQAAPTGGFAFTGRAKLNGGFPCTGPTCVGTLTGRAFGVALPGVNCAAGCTMTAKFAYAEPGGACVAGRVPLAPQGRAQGTYTIGSLTGNFNWVRVGLTAIITLSNPPGNGVGLLVPPAGTCGPQSVTVAGVANVR
jgi:hypothetical protein